MRQTSPNPACVIPCNNTRPLDTYSHKDAHLLFMLSKHHVRLFNPMVRTKATQRILPLLLSLVSTEGFTWPTRQIASTVKASAVKMSADSGEWVSLPADSLTAGERYGFLISAVVPRPVAVITSKSADGVVNCAPFSYSSLSSHDPPIVTHGIVLSRGQKKDTLKNIEETEEWVYHVLTKNYLEKANNCSASIPADKDETETFGLETLESDLVGAPRLKDSLVALECKLWDKKEVYNDAGAHTTTIVMGKVVQIHVHSSVLKDAPDGTVEGEKVPFLVDLEKLQAVGRAGDITYWPVGVTDSDAELKPMPRPK